MRVGDPYYEKRYHSSQYEHGDEHTPYEEEPPEPVPHRGEHVSVHDGVVYARYDLEQAQPYYDYYDFEHGFRNSLLFFTIRLKFQEKIKTGKHTVLLNRVYINKT